MAKTATPQIQTHPAAAVERAGRGATTPTGSPRVVKLAAWKSAQEQGRTVAGYDKASPIYGKTDVDVLAMIQASLGAAIAGSTVINQQPYDEALGLLTELLKRKTARQIAGKLYRS